MSAPANQALEFLQELPGTVHMRLYAQPSAALAVFRRMLPHLAKTIVMALVFSPTPFTAADLDAWIQPSSRPDKDRAIAVLDALHVIDSHNKTYSLSPVFRTSLRHALTGGGNHRSFGVPCTTPDDAHVDVVFLDRFARDKWEAILYYMVGSAGAGLAATGATTSQGTRTLLELGYFVEMKGSRAVITQAGFTFLLQDSNAQVWSLLVVYLKNAQQLKMEPVEVLSFLFTLGSLELGQDYSCAELTATQKHMLDDLEDFGIIYRTSPSALRFYPTRLATTLTSDTAALPSSTNTSLSQSHTDEANGEHDEGARTSGSGKGYIIVETNYRLYAYTSSPLQIAVLHLFTKLHARFPNMVSGKLTKESVQRAISYGITAEQIVSYLSAHAHPQMRKNNPVLPPTVVDQIRLWQIEGDRMQATAGFLLQEFGSVSEWEEVVKYADSLGVLVWKSENKRMLFVSRIQQISDFLGGRKGK